MTIVSEKVSTASENPFPAIGPQNQPPIDVEFYTPPSTAPRNILPYSPLDCLMELTDMFQDHESWGGSSRKPDLKVVSIIRNGKIIDDDFPERPCVAKKVETALSDGRFNFEEVFLSKTRNTKMDKIFRVYREPIVFALKKIFGIVKSRRNLRMRLAPKKGSRRDQEKRKLKTSLKRGNGRDEGNVRFENILMLEELCLCCCCI